MEPDRAFRERAPLVAGGRVSVDPSEFEIIRRAADGGDDWYVAALVHHDDRIAFVRNRWSDGWVLPGGGIEDGESMAAAAERKVREETGLDVDRRRPLAAVEQTFVADGDGSSDGAATAHMAVFEVMVSNSTFGENLGEIPPRSRRPPGSLRRRSGSTAWLRICSTPSSPSRRSSGPGRRPAGELGRRCPLPRPQPSPWSQLSAVT